MTHIGLANQCIYRAVQLIKPMHSVHMSSGHRAVDIREVEEVIWLWIGSHVAAISCWRGCSASVVPSSRGREGAARPAPPHRLPRPNLALEPTPRSVRSAPASGRGSPRAFGSFKKRSQDDRLIIISAGDHGNTEVL